MTLLEAVESLDSLDGKSTIYAEEPWTPASHTIVADEPEGNGLPVTVRQVGLKYFLEVFIARDVLEDWVTDSEPTLQDKCARLIQYAKNDA
jgi:hypothetical protein